MTREEIEYNARNCARMMYDTTLEREAYEKGYIKGVNDVQNPWISVEDRLPEKTEGVFSCQVRELEKNKIVYYKDTRGYIHTGYFNAIGHWRDLDRDNGAIYPVTHWMPIPKTK